MSEVLAALVGIVLVIAGVHKVLSGLGNFAQVVAAYRLLPASTASAVARLIPVAEVIIGTALLTGVGFPGTAIAAGSLLLAFCLAVVINLARGLTDISCGCFGRRSDERLSWHTAARAGFLAAAAFTSIWLPTNQLGSTSSLGPIVATVLAAMILAAISLLRAAAEMRNLEAAFYAGSGRGDGKE